LRLPHRCASLGGSRHGFVPIRNGQLGHFVAEHKRTSLALPAQQSRQRSRKAASGDMAL
jgi:hypothetical protein